LIKILKEEDLGVNASLEKGIVYIAFGEAFTREALFSAESVKKNSPGIDIAIFTNMKFESEYVDYVCYIKPNHIRSKVDFISYTPFKETIYLDSDTCIVRPIHDMFDVLKKYDVAAIHDFARKREKYANIVPEYGNIPYSFSEVNGGVFVFKNNEKTNNFFKIWKTYFYKYYQQTNGWDQVSLRIALWESNVNLYIMPLEYNNRGKDNRAKVNLPYVIKENGPSHMKPRILHMHVDKSIHKGVYNVKSYEEFENFCIENRYEY
jgi:hypothetical protein